MPPSPPLASTPADRLRIKRIYEDAHPSDGKRILIDRIWPRGMSKDRARLQGWEKDIAPSDDLRHWFHANPDRWGAFSARYRNELASNDDLLRRLVEYAKDSTVTLLYASKDEAHNNAVVLRDYLRHRIAREGGGESGSTVSGLTAPTEGAQFAGCKGGCHE
ncbi:DUF488 domain-containing protein [Antarcticimicrobium sediminis]|uniref:DUF488 domain-containing protein n=1 Tax=Antarcticimicrobium sediminis TaxID=2546227 RepID=A0A4V2Z7S7_9RHOB|nr:DUF488 domain-containing protein [Antarcticimicrobium sediminis]TDE37566.1 DUF488 domain-containing protein [Antarcticimicrobium sediminis]